MISDVLALKSLEKLGLKSMPNFALQSLSTFPTIKSRTRNVLMVQAVNDEAGTRCTGIHIGRQRMLLIHTLLIWFAKVFHVIFGFLLGDVEVRNLLALQAQGFEFCPRSCKMLQSLDICVPIPRPQTRSWMCLSY